MARACENLKTTISISRYIQIYALSLKDEVSDVLDNDVGWDIMMESLLQLANENKPQFHNIVEKHMRMAKFKCTVCGMILGSVKEVEEHFKTHQMKEDYTLIE